MLLNMKKKEEDEGMAETKKSDVGKGEAPNIVKEGRKLILPEGMSIAAGIDWLQKKEREENTMVAVQHEFANAFPTDTLVNIQRALADIYNWVDNIPTPGFFGPNPPVMITVRVGPGTGDFLQVPLGRVALPGIKGHLETVLHGPRGRQPSAYLTGEVRQGDKPKVLEIIKRVEERLLETSIYRGKAIRISWKWMRDGEAFDLGKHSPQFLDLTNADEAGLVFSEDVAKAIEQGLFTPIEQTEACRINGVPLKRGVLLEGPPGTGKTLVAYVTAAKAVKNGWGFVYLDDVRDIRNGLALARQYGRSVVFSEDMDRVVTGERDASMDEILNVLDGVDTKDQEIITVLTTNHIRAIIKPILRPGRVDTLLSTRPPDAEAAARLVVLYGRGLLDPTADIESVGNLLNGQIPAVIREVVERAKIAAIGRLKSAHIRGKVLATDLITAAKAMKAHADMLVEDGVPDTKRTVLIPVDIITKGTKTEQVFNEDGDLKGEVAA
jgi:transitional endoplasmic reticulum ATPase